MLAESNDARCDSVSESSVDARINDLEFTIRARFDAEMATHGKRLNALDKLISSISHDSESRAQVLMKELRACDERSETVAHLLAEALTKLDAILASQRHQQKQQESTDAMLAYVYRRHHQDAPQDLDKDQPVMMLSSRCVASASVESSAISEMPVDQPLKEVQSPATMTSPRVLSDASYKSASVFQLPADMEQNQALGEMQDLATITSPRMFPLASTESSPVAFAPPSQQELNGVSKDAEQKTAPLGAVLPPAECLMEAKPTQSLPLQEGQLSLAIHSPRAISVTSAGPHSISITSTDQTISKEARQPVTITSPRLLSLSSSESSSSYPLPSEQGVCAQLSSRHPRPLEPKESFISTFELELLERTALQAESIAQYVAEQIWRALPKRQGLRKGRCATVLMCLTPVFLLIVFINAAWIYYVVDYEVRNPTSAGPPFMEFVELAFLAIYTFELGLRLAVHGLHFFCNTDAQWNMLDFSLVIYSYLEMALTNLLMDKLMFLRTLRVLRMAKVLRVFRLVNFFSQLRIILQCLTGSFMCLLWSIIMMMLVFYMISMVIVQGVASYLSQSHGEIEDPYIDTMEHFGSVEASFLSLFKSVSGGDDWGVFYEALQPLGDFYSTIYLLFIAFSHVALLNILTGIFVENALKYAHPEMEQLRSLSSRSKENR
eukprot:TRINITY_DN45996_c0_g1_i1.p1 TRINITY_DN45996_c0_g1~~TRINITY_DN45996_c0_g1_i1.p1  ORF type:complete len:665 (-),score=69.03 TRINITY_DN45996_c0_g1_i1:196-2190(-)